MTNNSKKRITVTLSESLFNSLKTYGDEMGISVPALLVLYATEHMRQSQMMSQLPDMMASAFELNKIVGERESKKDS